MAAGIPFSPRGGYGKTCVKNVTKKSAKRNASSAQKYVKAIIVVGRYCVAIVRPPVVFVKKRFATNV